MDLYRVIRQFRQSKAAAVLSMRGFWAVASVVVFITTYMLILPAITKSTDTYCGKDEHVHDDSCYTVERTLICTEKEVEGHTHDDSCYTEKDKLVCGQKEVEAHTHDDSCYTENTELVCELEENEEHTHTAECYETHRSRTCGKKEREGHTHTAECYEKELELTCGKEEAEGHTHTDSCYKEEKTFTCKKEEHEHTTICYSNPKADVETAKVWKKTVKDAKLTGKWSEDVLTIAKTQLGYHESTKNYIVNEKGKKKGYSRYGDWYGNSYGDWCAMYVSFCLNYANIPTTADSAVKQDGEKYYFPIQAGCQRWIELLNREETPYYYAVNDHNSYTLINDSTGFEPEAGNLIFFNWDKEADADHVGLVIGVDRDEDGKITQVNTIEGNSSDQVRYKSYKASDSNIMGYAVIPENPNYVEPETEAETETMTEAENASESEIAEESESESMEETESEEETESVEETETETETESMEETEAAEAGTYTVEGEDFRVTVSCTTDAEIPAGVVLEAEQITDETDENRITEFLANDYTWTDLTEYDLRFAVDGETYSMDAPVNVDLAVKIPEEEEEQSRKMLLQLNSDDVEILPAEPTEEDGWIHYTYTQEELTKTVIAAGVIGQHTLTSEGDDYAVTVNYTDEANLPENVELVVNEIFGDEFDQKCEELTDMEETKDIQYVRIFDIAFMADGEELEPAVPVQVQITRKDLVDLVENMEPGIVHFGEEEPEVIEAELTTDEDGAATFEFEGESFSIYASYVSDPFKETADSTHPATIATVDTKALGITINMFDYWGDNATTNSNTRDVIDSGYKNNKKNYTNSSDLFIFRGINARHTNGTDLKTRLQNYLYFSASGCSFNQDNEQYPELSTCINAFTGANDGFSGMARQGIVNSTLTNGYPTLSTSGESLSYLFAPTNGQGNKKDYLNLNHLFKDIGNGYISYSSDTNYARLDTSSGNFKVYETTFDNKDGSKIGFFPFNDYDSTKTEVKCPSDATNYYNHHFGLTLSADFVIPTGKQINDKDIIFYFSGDDDMWLYLDDVLVLDIGGIHEPCDGEINFTTGDVTVGKLLKTGVVSASPGATTTIGANSTLAEIFAAAGKTWDTSADTVHTIKIFYMERGGCYSNLTMTMNLPIYSEVPVAVTKALEGTLKEEAADQDFTFQVMVEKESGTEVFEPYTGTLEVTGGSSNRTITADPDTGYFTIKGGETAITTGKFITTKKYYVNEVGIDGTLYEMVKVDGVEHTLIDPDDISDDPLTDTSTDVQSDITDSDVVFDPDEHTFKVSSNVAELYVMNTSQITNVIREEKTNLTVNKEWYNGNSNHQADTVRFKVYWKDVNNPNAEEQLLEYEGQTEFTLDAEHDWQKTFTDLMWKSLGREYTYRVEEIDVMDGYEVAYDYSVTDDGNTYATIKNDPKVNISVEKKWWKDYNSETGKGTEWPGHITNDGVQVQLYARYYKAASNNAVTVTFITGGRNFTEAQITTKKVGTGGNVTFSGSRWQGDYIRNATVTSGTAGNVTHTNNNVYTIKNIRSDITVYVTMNDMWENHLDSLRNRFNVSGTEPTITPEDKGVKKIGKPVTLKADPNPKYNWKYSWGILETPATKDGYTYTYFVKEVSNSNAYEVVYSNSYEITEKPDNDPDGDPVGKVAAVVTVDGKGKAVINNVLYNYELPETGGIGTTTYTLGGIFLMLSSLVLYGFSLRRRRERRVR